MRVVSVLPGATEMVAALGGLEHLVGVTHQCDHPPVVRSRAVVTAPAGVHGLALLEERIRALHPDLIVCEARGEGRSRVEEEVRGLASRLAPVPRVLALAATTIEGMLDEMRDVAAAIGLADEADEYVAGALSRLRRVHETLKSAGAPRPHVAVITGGEALPAPGAWLPGMIRKAGGVDVLAAAGAHSAPLTIDTVRGSAPDVIVVAPRGSDLAHSIAEGERLLAREDWSWARDRRVFAIDANAFVGRLGPRLVDGVEVLARCFNPSLFTPLDPSFARGLTPAARLA